MRKRITGRALIVAAALAGGVWMATAQQPKKVDDAALRSVGKNGGEWLTYGRL
jgi:hypothetical protein